MIRAKAQLKFFSISMLFLFPCIVFAENVETSLWDQWLDNAYKLTWHSSKEIDTWIKENEKKIFKEPLLAYVGKREKYLLTNQGNRNSLSFSDRFYRRVSIAEMLLYLQTKNPTRLAKAAKIISHKRLKNKTDLPEISFWFHYIQAHLKMNAGASEAFINHIYALWLNTILKLETPLYEFGTSGLPTELPGFYQSLPFLYQNVANLIISRAILEKRLTHLDALGPIIWNLSHRMSKNKNYGQLVNQISDRISGSKSDIFRLTYTVLLMDAETQKQITEDLVDSSTNVKAIKKNIVKAFENYDHLYQITQNQMGKVVVLTQHLNLTSFILSRLHKSSKQRIKLKRINFLQRKKNQAWHEPLKLLSKAINSYDDLAVISVKAGDWQRHGFSDRYEYVTMMQELWQAIMNFALENGFYYRNSIDSKSAQTYLTNTPLLEKSIGQYLDLFEKYVSSGDLDIVPDNAYYGAAESAQLLAETYYMRGPWKKSVKNYEKGFYYCLQGIEIFPFEVKSYYQMASQLSQIGRLDLYDKSLILLIEKLKHSHVIDKFITIKNSQYLGRPLAQLRSIIPKIISLAPSNIVLKKGIKTVPKEILDRLGRAQKKIENMKDGFNKNTNDKLKITHFMAFINAIKKKGDITKQDIEKIDTDLMESIKITAQYDQNPYNLKINSDADVFSIRNITPNRLNSYIQELTQIHQEINILKNSPDYDGIRAALVLEADHPYHKLIRELYHENSRKDFNHLKSLTGDNFFIVQPQKKRIQNEFK